MNDVMEKKALMMV